jgi:YD repeat-containing protein
MLTRFFLCLLLSFLLIAPAAHAASASYTYDALGRVIQVVYDNGMKIVYIYDAAGNRTVQTVTCGTGGC